MTRHRRMGVIAGCAAFLSACAGWSAAQTNAPAPAATNQADVATMSLDPLDLRQVEALSPADRQALCVRLDAEVRLSAERMSALRADVERLKTEARRSNPDIAALNAKMLELRKQIQATLEALPDVKAKSAELSAAQQRVVDLSKNRAKVQSLIQTAGEAPAAPASGAEQKGAAQ